MSSGRCVEATRTPFHTERLVGIGMSATTVLDSVGMGRLLLESRAKIPVIEVIEQTRANRQPPYKTLFAVIEREETVKKAIEVIMSIYRDLHEPGKGILFTSSPRFL